MYIILQPAPGYFGRVECVCVCLVVYAFVCVLCVFFVCGCVWLCVIVCVVVCDWVCGCV